MKTILSAKLSDQLTKIPENEAQKKQLENHVFWQNKIWVLKIIHKWISRHANMQHLEKSRESLNIYNNFHNTYAIPFCKDIIAMISKYKIQFMPSAAIYFSLKYIASGIQTKNTMGYMFPFLENIVYKCLIPCLELTPEDQEIWNQNPKEYIQRDKYDSEIEEDPRSITRTLLEELAQIQT